MSGSGSFRSVSESGFRLCVLFGEVVSDQKHVVVQNQQTNKQKPFSGGPRDDERNESIFFPVFCFSQHKNPNNLGFQNLKLDCLKGTIAVFSDSVISTTSPGNRGYVCNRGHLNSQKQSYLRAKRDNYSPIISLM